MRPSQRRNVVFGFIGTTLDTGAGAKRWDRWRPTVAACMHEDFAIDRLELWTPPRSGALVTGLTADIAEVSPATEVRTHEFAIADPWDFSEVYPALDAFVETYPFAPDKENYYVHITTGTHVAQICLFLLCETRALPGVLLQTSPSRGRKADASGQYTIIDLDLTRYDALAARFSRRQQQGTSLLKAGIATQNPAFNQLIKELEHVAGRSKDAVLLSGETGTGKTELARRLYQLKQQRHQINGPLVMVNCATLRGDGAMSALFGHTRGAFTGAAEARAGFLRQADRGVLFLDEIGELGLDEQAMLLTALEEKRFYPVGSDREARSHFQLIAGTNRDLAAQVARGAFREDLLARIATWHYHLPPLRDRPEDLVPNLEHELLRHSQDLGMNVTMSAPAKKRFVAFATSTEGRWAHNFRDLGNAVRRMATLCDGGRIGEHDVAGEIARLRLQWSKMGFAGATTNDEAAALPAAVAALLPGLDRFDVAQLRDVAAVCQGSRSLSDAGRVLFAKSRALRTSTNDADRLRKYLDRFGLTFSSLRQDRAP